MYLAEKTITAYNSSQIAYPVGIDKSSYNICSWFHQDVETNEIMSIHQVVKNLSYPERPKDQPLKEGKFRELLFTGTYKECEQFIVNRVNKEGEWTYDSKFNYVHPVYSNQ